MSINSATSLLTTSTNQTGASTSAANTGTSAADKARTQVSTNTNSFLKLLTTQLKYQDPLSPQDSTQFVAQLAQFSAVEQSVATNKNLENLLAAQQTSQVMSAVNYIGSTVEATGDTTALTKSGAAFNYNLAGPAKVSAINITDSQGTIIYTGAGENQAGKHTFTWDGKNNAGVTQPAGNYTFSIGASDAKGNPVQADTTVTGVVTGIKTASTTDPTTNVTTQTVTLDVSGSPVSLSNLLSVQ